MVHMLYVVAKHYVMLPSLYCQVPVCIWRTWPSTRISVSYIAMTCYPLKPMQRLPCIELFLLYMESTDIWQRHSNNLMPGSAYFALAFCLLLIRQYTTCCMIPGSSRPLRSNPVPLCCECCCGSSANVTTFFLCTASDEKTVILFLLARTSRHSFQLQQCICSSVAPYFQHQHCQRRRCSLLLIVTKTSSLLLSRNPSSLTAFETENSHPEHQALLQLL